MRIRLSVFLALLFIFLFSFDLKSDDPVKGVEPVTYKLAAKYYTNVANIFKFTEVSEFTRIFDDSSTHKFKRESTFYFSLNSRSIPENGFTTLDVTIDSLVYRFTEGEAVYKFNSQDEDPGDIAFNDLQTIFVPLGKSFDMVYSPYGEVAKIEGEKLDWLRNYINKDGSSLMDTVENFMWLDGISKERLEHITNLQKFLFLPGPILQDSSWKSLFNIQIDRKNFFDTVDVKIEKIKEGFITINAISKNLTNLPQSSIFYGIKGSLVPVTNSRGTGNYKIELSPRGTIRYAEANFNVDIGAKKGNSKFTDKVQVKMTWQLLGQYKL